jgi:hypothetical protein
VYVVANGRIGKGVRWQSKSATIMLGSSLTILAINGSAFYFLIDAAQHPILSIVMLVK